LKIVEQLMIKIMNLYEEFDYRKFDLKSISHFYKNYNLSLAILGLEDKKAGYKNLLWIKLLESQIEGKFNLKVYTKLQEFMKKDFAVISEAMREISKQNEQLGYDVGDLWTEGAIALPHYELED